MDWRLTRILNWVVFHILSNTNCASTVAIMVRCVYEEQERINREIKFRGILYTLITHTHTHKKKKHTHIRYHKLCLMLLLNMEPTVVAAVESNEAPIVFPSLFKSLLFYPLTSFFFLYPNFASNSNCFCYLRPKAPCLLCSVDKMIEKHETKTATKIGATCLWRSMMKTLIFDWLIQQFNCLKDIGLSFVIQSSLWVGFEPVSVTLGVWIPLSYRLMNYLKIILFYPYFYLPRYFRFREAKICGH